MYEAEQDPYCYAGTSVLKNLFGHRRQPDLDKAEFLYTNLRARQGIPPGRLDYSHYRAIHRHLFQDCYRWAGRIRTVAMSKDGSRFCEPQYIDREMNRLFVWLADENRLRDLQTEAFATKAARFLAELNAIHPFREGNGRAQMVFLSILADQAGHPLDLDRLDAPAVLNAMIASFHGDEGPLAKLILGLMRRPD